MDTNIIPYYKVVRCEQKWVPLECAYDGIDVLYSIKISSGNMDNPSPYRVIYKIGQFVEAPVVSSEKGYHLFVLDNIEMARFACEQEGENSHIYQCEVEGICEELPVKLDYMSLIYGGKREAEIYKKWPRGTIMVKRVKLTKRILNA